VDTGSDNAVSAAKRVVENLEEIFGDIGIPELLGIWVFRISG
jgi:hypothetical protein